MRRELFRRVIGALVFVFVLLVFVYTLERVWLNAFVLAILTIGFYEWARLCAIRGKLSLILACALFFAAGALGYFAVQYYARVENPVFYHAIIRYSACALGVFWLLAAIALVYLIRAGVGFSRPLLSELGLLSRLGLLGLGVVLLLPCLWFVDNIYFRDSGRLMLMFFLGICIMMDVMAFFSGKTLGRDRLCPNISANKTVQGLFGGIIASAVWVLAMWLNFLQPLLPLAFVACMSLVIAAAVVGDLFESLIKRLAQAKDSGSVVYGHGGMLDRIDSMVAALPVFVFVLGFFL